MLLFSAVSGSRLYGTHRPDSDVDTRGVFAETRRELLGFNRPDVVERKGEGDTVLYSIHKFVTLALKGNPNIIEMAFTPPDKWLNQSGLWEDMYQNRHKLLSKQCVAPYLGYATAQMKRIQAGKSPQQEKRQASIEKYGYDVKDAAHCIRLLAQVQDILFRGDFSPVLEGGALNYVQSILNGERSFKQVEWTAQYMTITIKGIEEQSKLPEHPDTLFFHNLVLDYYTDNLTGVLY